MRDILGVSLQTAKPIDEIGFRSDLLALSTSIEMACTGEDRTEFALVGNKVRDLARRGALVAKLPRVDEQERNS